MITAAEWQAIRLSLLVSGTAILVLLPPAAVLAWLLARKRFWGKAIVENLVNLPLVLPPIVTGYLLLVVLGRRGLIGGWLGDAMGVRFTFRWEGAAIAAAIMALPLVVRALRSAFEAVDVRLEQAARSLGAGPVDLFFTVTLPLARGGVIAGAILGFARALGEFGATIVFAGNVESETRTLPLAVFTMLNRPDGLAQSWRLVLASVLISAVALFVSARLERASGR